MKTSFGLGHLKKWMQGNISRNCTETCRLNISAITLQSYVQPWWSFDISRTWYLRSGWVHYCRHFSGSQRFVQLVHPVFRGEVDITRCSTIFVGKKATECIRSLYASECIRRLQCGKQLISFPLDSCGNIAVTPHEECHQPWLVREPTARAVTATFKNYARNTTRGRGGTTRNKKF